MQFSTRTTYGLRAMIYLAKKKKSGSVSLAKIAKEENLSLKYLERIFAKLKKADLVKAEKGVSGGYVLTKEPSSITVYDIVKVLEGTFAVFHCSSDDGKVYCRKSCQCGANLVLVKVQQSIASVLKDMKLKDLV